MSRIRNVKPFIAVTAAGVSNRGWQAVVITLDSPVIDGRVVESAGFDWREPPLTLMYQPTLDEGHDGAYPVGRIDRIWRAGNQVLAEGLYLDDPESTAVADLVGDEVVTGVSVDLAVHRVTVPMPEMPILAEGDIAEDSIEIDTAAEAPTLNESTMIGLTVLPQQADTDATIMNLLPGATIPDVPVGVTAAAAGLAPVSPPRHWFTAPDLGAPTALTVTDEGRVYGHIATWGVCHTGHQGRCLPPEQLSGLDSTYEYFHLGDLVTAEGDHLAVGTLCMDGGHADPYATASKALATYDDTSTGVADVRLYNDEHGIACAGAIRPDVDTVALRRFRASKPSGDWRPINGRFELVHVLAVNSPGYPVPRTIFSEDNTGREEPLAVMAAGFNPGLYPDALKHEDRLAQHRVKALAIRADGGLPGLVKWMS